MGSVFLFGSNRSLNPSCLRGRGCCGRSAAGPTTPKALIASLTKSVGCAICHEGWVRQQLENAMNVSSRFRRSGSADHPSFDTYVATSIEGLKLQAQSHQTIWGLGEAERWDIDQNAGQLIFTFG